MNRELFYTVKAFCALVLSQSWFDAIDLGYFVWTDIHSFAHSPIMLIFICFFPVFKIKHMIIHKVMMYSHYLFLCKNTAIHLPISIAAKTWESGGNGIMEEKLKLYGFNNLTKSLSFNIYDVCYAKTAREQQDYIAYIDEQYNSQRLTKILTTLTDMIGAQVLNISRQDYDPQGASVTLLIADNSMIPAGETQKSCNGSHISGISSRYLPGNVQGRYRCRHLWWNYTAVHPWLSDQFLWFRYHYHGL